MASYTFQDLLSVIVVSAPGFELEDDLDLDTAFQQLRDALATLPAAQEATTRQNALDAIAAAHDAFRAGDLRGGGQQLQEVHSILFSKDAPAHCIGSYGGPRVLVARDTLDQWLGASEEDEESHYDAACGVDDLGVIEPFGAPVLVLGCAPVSLYATTSGEDAVLWGWEFGDTEAEMEQLATEVARARSFESVVAFVSSGGPHWVFDGAVAGDEIEEHLALELEPGEWHVGYAYVERGDMAVSVYAIHRPG